VPGGNGVDDRLPIDGVECALLRVVVDEDDDAVCRANIEAGGS